MHLRKMVSTFYKGHPEKPIVTSAPLDSAPPMAKSTIQLLAKQKQGRSTGCAEKRAKWDNKEETTRKNPSRCGFRARSWQVARDLSPWRRERWEACSGSLTIGSSTPEELHSTLFWPRPLSSKFLID